MARIPARLRLISLSLCLSQLCAAQTTAQPPAPVPTLKAQTKIVVIDVVVTDKQGQPVKKLNASDFTLAENGTAQTINHFDEHSSLSPDDAAKIVAMPKLPDNTFTNYSPVKVDSSLNVLLIDSLNTKMIDQSVVVKQVLKYLDTPHPGVRMELFEFDNSGLRLLQGFTTDQQLLRAALASRKAAQQASVMFINPMSDDPGITKLQSNYGQSKGSDFSTSDPAGTDELAAIHLLSRQSNTFNAMSALARYMGALPGRKNLLWFSASFSISPRSREIADHLHETMALFARHQVAVYPITAGGLTVHYAQLPQVRSSQPVTTDVMDLMAQDTGGKVFKDSNDIAAAVDKAVDNGSNYYTLTYTPANRDWKGEFRKVEVRLEQKGYTLAYRPGYYADDIATDKPAPKAVAASTPPDPARSTLLAAMEYGAPQPSDVTLKVAINPATGRPENTPAKLNALDPKVSAPFERYILSVAALPQAFTFTRDTPGKIHMAARLVTRVYSADGALINTTTVNAIGDIPDARYQTIMADGVQFKQEISVPLKGDCFLRIGVEDLATSHVGVVEVPIAMVAKLKPLAYAPPNP